MEAVKRREENLQLLRSCFREHEKGQAMDRRKSLTSCSHLPRLPLRVVADFPR